MYLHFCIDLDGTLTETHINAVDDVSACNIKGYGRIGPLINRAAEEQTISFTTYKDLETQSDLIDKVLIESQVSEAAKNAAAIIAYKPAFPDFVGKNLHRNYACVEHGIEPDHYLHILIDDNVTNCELFRKQGGVAILVNWDLSHLDVIEQMLNLPHFAKEIAEEHYAIASEARQAADERAKHFVR